MNIDQLEQAVEHMKAICDNPEREVLLFCKDEDRCSRILNLLENFKATVVIAESEQQALSLIREKQYDCIFLDIDLTEASAYQWLQELSKDAAEIPVLLYPEREMTDEEQKRLLTLSQTAILKQVSSPGQFLFESSLYLRRKLEGNLAEFDRLVAENLPQSEAAAAKKVLIVDDDIRNIFALTSLLERHTINVRSTDSGQDALNILQEDKEIGLVLVDIMMPVMDGYETIAAIRKIPQFQELPVIALTAKAMKGDREKCLEAGATDYITKPVNNNQLIASVKSWLIH